MTTDKGFSILDYQHKEFRNYDELPLSCISENALYKSRKGEIFIGGTTGMISFRKRFGTGATILSHTSISSNSERRKYSDWRPKWNITPEYYIYPKNNPKIYSEHFQYRIHNYRLHTFQ